MRDLAIDEGDLTVAGAQELQIKLHGEAFCESCELHGEAFTAAFNQRQLKHRNELRTQPFD